MGSVLADAARVEATTPRPLIEFTGVEKTYRLGKLNYRALRGIDLHIYAGDLVAVVGPSGSGKTTILNLLTGIDRPTAGTVTVDGRDLTALSEEDLATWRGANVGIIFQFFQLLPTLTALENAVLPLDFARQGAKRERVKQAQHNLELVGLGDKGAHLPAELSGGEQQRVAIARALVTGNPVLLADEPTGDLDFRTGVQILELLEAQADQGRTVIVVTHNREISRIADRVIELSSGRVASDGPPSGGKADIESLRW